jgi:alkylation response protein AidB-like acyl-CoA dehydrogenase
MQLSDDERDELRDAARRFLDSEISSTHVRALLDDETGFDRQMWSKMADLGWLAIHVPEADGGMGASYTDVIVILHELGRHVAPTPFLSSAILSAEALRATPNDDLRREWLPAIVSGERIATVACAGPSGSYEPHRLGIEWRSDRGLHMDGVARFVPDAHIADAVVVAAADSAGRVASGLLETSAPGVRVTVEPTVDETRRLCRVELDDVAIADDRLLGPPGDMTSLHRRLTSVGAVAVCADALGAAERVLEISTQYAKERQQFGRPIGSFQAVKHHCANMLTAVEGSRAAISHAGEALDDPMGDVDEAASVGKSYAAPACAQVCQTAVQVHGGIGFTWEHDAHLYLKRTKLDEALFGSTSWHRRRLAERVLAR